MTVIWNNNYQRNDGFVMTSSPNIREFIISPLAWVIPLGVVNPDVISVDTSEDEPKKVHLDSINDENISVIVCANIIIMFLVK